MYRNVGTAESMGARIFGLLHLGVELLTFLRGVCIDILLRLMK